MRTVPATTDKSGTLPWPEAVRPEPGWLALVFHEGIYVAL